MIDRDKGRRQVAELIVAATSGAIGGVDEVAVDVALYDLGVDSLGWLRLIDAIEQTYDTEIDLGGIDLRVATVDSLVDHINTG
jgi:acyl carrier protein